MGIFPRRRKLVNDETRTLTVGKGNIHGTNNAVRTAKYTLWSFFPKALKEQFRRNANIYFLGIGVIMFLGTYTPLFETSISPWTTLGPLAVVVAISLTQEGVADYARHKSDVRTNNHSCVVLKRSEDVDATDIRHHGKTARKRDERVLNGQDVDVKIAESSVSIAFESVKRQDIYAGDIVLVRNREMIPVDLVLLASSGEQGSAYIETSPIDGETNLKLRKTPNIPLPPANLSEDSYTPPKHESLEHAVRRIARFTLLGYPDGVSISYIGGTNGVTHNDEAATGERKPHHKLQEIMHASEPRIDDDTKFVASLMAEAPNASVNTFSGKLTLPPYVKDGHTISIPLEAENLLLRGAMLRNIDWVVGVAAYTGIDTKLVRNSTRTPSKFSRLDVLMNRLVILILITNIVVICVLAALASWHHKSQFETLWYIGFAKDTQRKWPYLPDSLDPPDWSNKPPMYYQSLLTYLTLTSNFVPLSLYVTVEMITLFMMFLIGWDKTMYHKETDTPAVARSTIVTDLGLCKYVFTDKTGTLTQNIMKFMRCSVDGFIFGAPVLAETPGREKKKSSAHEYLPLHCLIRSPHNSKGRKNKDEFSLDIGLDSPSNSQSFNMIKAKEAQKKNLTFNGEMFLRVLSICHSVVVEKEHDSVIVQEDKVKKPSSLLGKLTTGRKKVNSPTGSDIGKFDAFADSPKSRELQKSRSASINDVSETPSDLLSSKKSSDGSPWGFAYQAESPDEGALVAAASNVYDFQFISRETDGVKVACSNRSILSEQRVIEGIKLGTLTSKQLAYETASPHFYDDRSTSTDANFAAFNVDSRRVESWTVLAINKFDSDRKRMSVLVRSPPELGSLSILLCKGADTTMLKTGVCEGDGNIIIVDDGKVSFDGTRERIEVASVTGADKWETNEMLEIQAHLGEFATEGLRTLVLGIRFISESECDEWLTKYKAAATSMKDRSILLRKAADDIEKNLHIVGATAIEDKLQDGVPDAIRHLGDSGIKLWVLTGDKKETALEIGYATKVLIPQMIVSEVGEASDLKVKSLVAMDFIKLVKSGNLPLYQRSALKSSPKDTRSKRNLVERRKKVRDLAESILRQYLETPEGRAESNSRKPSRNNVILEEEKDDMDDVSVGSDSVPEIFTRAKIARDAISSRGLSSNIIADDKAKVSDEDVLSEDSIQLSDAFTGLFDKKKRTILEQLFSVDRDVRHGNLVKHLASPLEQKQPSLGQTDAIASRGLVIEGGALAHFLGDTLLEEMLFAVASKCDSVIACRVTPKQKALVVRLARTYDGSNPVTLAIGDGANDVGMIQEAQIGVGISGLEGQQAVNASDFAIAQFRFLEELLLIHGRWNFMRMSKVVLFSFYKNAVLVGLLVAFSGINLYSGTTLFDMWITSAFNFVCGVPILFLGFFDRDLEKDYVKRNSHVYKAGPNNEHLSLRVALRWAGLVLVHTVVIYSICASSLLHGGGMSSAFRGFMYQASTDFPGDGDGDNWKVYGTTIYLVLVFTLAYKVLYECRSLIHGKWPAYTCKKNVGDGFSSRVAYTWVGVTWGSIIFTIVGMYLYSLIGKSGYSTFSDFTCVAMHVFQRRLMTWMLILLVPTAATVVDVSGKVYSNFYYPTQTQIHIEMQAHELKEKKRVTNENRSSNVVESNDDSV